MNGVKLRIEKLASLDSEELFLIVMNAVGWPALLAALYFWGPT